MVDGGSADPHSALVAGSILDVNKERNEFLFALLLQYDVCFVELLQKLLRLE